MPFCPMCKENIDSLKAWFSTPTEYVFSLNKDGAGHYKEVVDGGGPEPEVDDFACPECNVTLFWKESEAIDFLGGGE